MSDKPRVLIVEDSAPSANLVASLVELAGGCAEVYSCGADGLSAVKSGPFPELVIVDLRLPDGNGCDWARQMREVRGDDLVIWACSACSAEELVETAWEDMPFAGWVKKPFDARELLVRLGDFLSVPA